MNGRLNTGDKLLFMQAGATHDADEVGVRTPEPTPVGSLGPGEVGYLIAGIKDVREARSGETLTTAAKSATEPLEGYREPQPMVFCGLYPVDGDDYEDFRDALDKLRLDDGSFTFEPETSTALGFGFRCGFLGLLHMEIVRERLEREFDLNLIATSPSVKYKITMNNGEERVIDNPSALPPPNDWTSIDEPHVRASMITPSDYTGTLMELCQARRGQLDKMEYLSPERLELVYDLPLADVVIDFFDQLKSRSQGLRQPRLRTGRLPERRPRQSRHPAQRRAGRRVLHDRSPRQLLRVRSVDGRETAGDHSSPAVRGSDPGRHRRPDHRQRNGEGLPEGRHREALRRRRHQEKQVVEEAEGGQTKDEEHRSCGDSAGHVHPRPPARRVRSSPSPPGVRPT